jgi:hypothetical protein
MVPSTSISPAAEQEHRQQELQAVETLLNEKEHEKCFLTLSDECRARVK